MTIVQHDGEREILLLTRQLRSQFPFVPGQPVDVRKVQSYMHHKGYPWGTMDIGLLNEELLKEF